MEIFFVAKRAFRKASVGVLTRETSYPEARETSAELMAEQGEAGSGFGRRPLPCQCGSGAIAHVWVS
jgi:hypothetical protein